MTDHFLDLRINRYGVIGHWKCEADPDAFCRTRCPLCDEEIGCCVEDEHPRAPYGNGFCRVKDWLENACWDETYNGPDDVDAHSGPVAVTWEGDDLGYSWRYA